MLVCYFGNGQERDGAWCFRHGYITFEDILRVYKEHFAGKMMTVLSDCPLSHQWIQKYHIYLDQIHIRPCGHSGRKLEKFLQVIATSNEGCSNSSMVVAARALYIDESGRTHIHLDGFKVDEGQHLSYCTPYQLTCKAAKVEDRCLLPHNVAWCKDPNLGQRIAFLRNESKTRWAYVHVHDDQIVNEVQRGYLRNTGDYFEVIKEGGGCNPPMHTRKEMYNQYPLMTRINYDDQ